MILKDDDCCPSLALLIGKKRGRAQLDSDSGEQVREDVSVEQHRPIAPLRLGDCRDGGTHSPLPSVYAAHTNSPEDPNTTLTGSCPRLAWLLCRSLPRPGRAAAGASAAPGIPPKVSCLPQLLLYSALLCPADPTCLSWIASSQSRSSRPASARHLRPAESSPHC